MSALPLVIVLLFIYGLCFYAIRFFSKSLEKVAPDLKRPMAFVAFIAMFYAGLGAFSAALIIHYIGR